MWDKVMSILGGNVLGMRHSGKVAPKRFGLRGLAKC
jgi:hypothetical protein